MKKTIHFISGLTVLALILVSFRDVHALTRPSLLQAGKVYYVSPSGSDSNPCTLEAPCATFNHVTNLAASGDLILALAGTYSQALTISKSGITVEGQNAVITASPFGIKIESAAQNVTVRGFTVTGTESHAIYILGQFVTVENNTVYHNVLENGSLTGGVITCFDTAWGSAIKVGLGGSNVTIRNNTVYENCGEGIAATRGSNVLIENNTVYDNKSVNIYVDNSYHVRVLNNNIRCVSVFPKGVALGEESYADWGAQLRDVTVSGNTVMNCSTGIMAFTSDVGGTLTDVTITSNNIPTAQKRGISLDNNANSNVVVSNNIHFNSIWVRSPQGVTLTGNTQVSGTPSPSPTVTSTSMPTSTPIATQTSTPLPTSTSTPTPTSTKTQTFTPTATIPAETYFDNTHAAFVYSGNWTTVTKSQAYGSSFKETSKNGASVIFNFTGQSFSILYTGGPAYRSMKVYVDNVQVGTINQKMGQRTYQVRWDYIGQLSPGTHTLKLVFSTTSSTGTKGSIDVVIVR